MKRVIIIISACLIICLVAIYLIQISNKTISQTTINNTSEGNVSKFLLYENNWLKWWPGEKDLKNRSFSYNGIKYTFEKKTNSGLYLNINDGKRTLKGEMLFFPIDMAKTKLTFNIDSINWNGTINPISRYLEYRKINSEVTKILYSFYNYMNDPKQVYGYEIHLSKVKDSVMLVSLTTLNQYPSPIIIEKMVLDIKQQIKAQNGIETNYPMLNVNQLGKENYQVMVAIPTNKVLKPGKNTVVNKMILGNILEAKIIGGSNTIQDAFNQIKIFMKDYRLSSPAIPFESMITDRSKQPDSSKWVTKIYYPIL